MRPICGNLVQILAITTHDQAQSFSFAQIERTRSHPRLDFSYGPQISQRAEQGTVLESARQDPEMVFRGARRLVWPWPVRATQQVVRVAATGEKAFGSIWKGQDGTKHRKPPFTVAGIRGALRSDDSESEARK